MVTINLVSDERLKGETHCADGYHGSSSILSARDDVESSRLAEAGLKGTLEEELGMFW